MGFSAYDNVIAEIMCGEHREICCLEDKTVFDKVLYWLAEFGADRTRKLIKLACACETPETPAPPGERPPVTQNEPPTFEPPVFCCPPGTTKVTCSLPPPGSAGG